MRRGAILVGLLAIAVVVALLMALFGEDGQRRSRRDLEARRDAGREGGELAEADEGERARSGTSARAVDDDPNRIDGPELVVRGIVVRLGKPVAGARVMLRRSRPADTAARLSWLDPRRQTEAPPPIVEGESDENGRFLLRAPRRSRVTVTAMAEGCGPASVGLFVPRNENPAEVTLNLTAGFSLRGIVVNGKGKPLEGAKLRCSDGGWQSYPINSDAVTGGDGRFEFADLSRGTVVINVDMEGYPGYRHTVAVPEATEIQLKLFPGGSLRGTIKDDKGNPVAGALLLLGFSADGELLGGRAETVSGADGSYEVARAPASLIRFASVEHPDWGRRASNQGDLRLPLEPIDPEKERVWDIELKAGATVRGIVVDKLTGQPVPGAALKFMRLMTTGRNLTEARFAQSGPDGRFETLHVLEGSYWIRVEAESHSRPVVSWMRPNQKLDPDFFTDGVKSPKELRIEVERGGRVEGRIPAEALGSWSQTSVQFVDNTGWAQVDATGFFVFEHVPVGENKQVRCWSPSCQSDPFAVLEGQVTTVEMKGDMRPHFTGIVVGASGDPVAGAYVKACPEANIKNEMRSILQQRGWGTARTDAEGRFSLTVPEWQAKQGASADWAIAAVSYEYPLQVQTGIRLPKQGESREVRIVLEAGGVIAGMVEFAGRGSIPNVRVSISPVFDRTPKANGDARQSRYTYTDLAGRFEVKGVGDGAWTVSAYHADGKAESVTAAAGDTDVRIELQPTLSLAGIVLDENGDPLANARIGAVVAGGPKESIRWTATDTSGRFRISQLEPGDYPIEVTPQARTQNVYYGGMAQETAGFKKTRTRAYPAGTEDIVIKVEAGNTIRGRVLDPGGQPLGGAGVMGLPKTKGLKLQPTAFTNGNGEFTLKGVEQGEYEIVVMASGYLIESTTATVGQRNVEVRLREGGKIEGVLLAPDGTPVGGQWVQVSALDREVSAKLQDWQRRGNAAWNNLGGWEKMAMTTDSDGKFSISGLFPGKYRLYLTSPQGVAPDTELSTDSGSVTIQLRPALSITGRIVTEEGGAPVVQNGQLWVMAQQNGRHFGSVQADSEGNFEVKGLPAGEISLQVWSANAYQTAIMNATAGDRNVRIVVKKAPATPKGKR